MLICIVPHYTIPLGIPIDLNTPIFAISRMRDGMLILLKRNLLRLPRSRLFIDQRQYMLVDIVVLWAVNMLVLSIEKLRIPKFNDIQFDCHVSFHPLKFIRTHQISLNHIVEVLKQEQCQI